LSGRFSTKAISGSTFGWISSLVFTSAPSGTLKLSTRKPNTGVSTPICFILACEVSPAFSPTRRAPRESLRRRISSWIA
jgi:hypothetical protein